MRLAAIVICGLVLLGACSKEPQPAPVTPVSPPPPPPQVAPPPPPSTSVRLFARLPAKRNTVESVRALVKVGDQVADSRETQTLASSQLGHSVLILITQYPNLTEQVSGARALLKGLQAHDRVAVGFVSRTGFKLTSKFSVDTRTAEGALGQFTGRTESQKVGQPLPLYRALTDALNVFRSHRSLPLLRHIVMLSDGMDRHVQRAGPLRRKLVQIQQRAVAARVHLNLLGYGLKGDPLERLAKLADSTNGEYHLVPFTASPEKEIITRFAAIGESLGRWSVVDASVRGEISRETTVAMTLKLGSDEHAVSQRVTLPAPGNKRFPIDMETAEPLPTRLPPGITAERDLIAEARRAEESKKPFMAGVLWHLAAQKNPEDGRSISRAREIEKQLKSQERAAGKLLVAGKQLPAHVAISQQLGLYKLLWTESTGWQTGLNELVAPRPQPLDTVRQTLLHRCNAPTADRCAQKLLDADQVTHFFIDAAGTIVQLLDAARPVVGVVPSESPGIHVHLAAPEPGALAFQPPGHRQLWRHLREAVDATDSEPSGVKGFGYTHSQYESLMGLLASITQAFPNVQPRVPVDMNQRPTSRQLVDPSNFAGILTHSNWSDEFADCPGPGLELTRFYRAIKRGLVKGRSLNMESWVSDLKIPGRRHVAINRFRAAGSLATPLLQEVMEEWPRDLWLPVIDALTVTGDARAQETLLKVLESPLNSGAGGLSLAPVYRVIHAIGRTGTASAIGPLVEFLTKSQLSLSHGQATRLKRLIVGAALAISDGPGQHKALKHWLTDGDASVRAQVAQWWLELGGTQAASALLPLLDDPSPEVRLIAGQSLGRSGSDFIVGLKKHVGIPRVVAALESMSVSKIPADVFRWYGKTESRANKAALRRLFIKSKAIQAIPLLAESLPSLVGRERARVLQTLTLVTGRDLGTEPNAWLQWMKGRETTPR